MGQVTAPLCCSAVSTSDLASPLSVYSHCREGVGGHCPVLQGMKQVWRRSRLQTSRGPQNTRDQGRPTEGKKELRRVPDEGSLSSRGAEARGGCSDVPVSSAGSQLCLSDRAPGREAEGTPPPK
ncbi:hypothetical protein ACER0C_003540 [Sarotherodon galilaeus]